MMSCSMIDASDEETTLSVHARQMILLVVISNLLQSILI